MCDCKKCQDNPVSEELKRTIGSKVLHLITDELKDQNIPPTPRSIRALADILAAVAAQLNVEAGAMRAIIEAQEEQDRFMAAVTSKLQDTPEYRAFVEKLTNAMPQA
jgi:hypothetical protein